MRWFGRVQRRNSEYISKKDAEVGTGEAGRQKRFMYLFSERECDVNYCTRRGRRRSAVYGDKGLAAAPEQSS